MAPICLGPIAFDFGLDNFHGGQGVVCYAHRMSRRPNGDRGPSAPEEHNVYSNYALIPVRSSGAPCAFVV